MDRGERWITVLGLLGTFLLPWPEGEAGGRSSGSRVVAPEMKAHCAVLVAQPVENDCDRNDVQAARPASGRT